VTPKNNRKFSDNLSDFEEELNAVDMDFCKAKPEPASTPKADRLKPVPTKEDLKKVINIGDLKSIDIVNSMGVGATEEDKRRDLRSMLN